MTEKVPARRWRMSRRGFLIGAAALGGSVALGYVFGWPALQLRAAELLDSGTGRPAGDISTDPTVWIEIAPDNRVTLYIPKTEMGQGVHTSLAQILADELGADWQMVRVRQADTAHGPIDSAGTTGSSSVSTMWPVMRSVAATLREMLRLEAARQWGVAAAEVQIENGAALSLSGLRLTLGEVVAAKQGEWEAPPGEAALKPKSAFTLVGQPVARVDLPDKVTGAAVYGFDARLPGMLFGAVAQPPTLGAQLRRASPGTAASLPGVVQVVLEAGFAGVVAESRQQALAALSALDLDWDEGRSWAQSDIEAMLTIDPGSGIVIQQDGAGASGLKADALEARYSTPLAAHAQLEPQAALAEVGAEAATVWVSTQLPALTRAAVAEALGLNEAQVTIVPAYLGGGFGRKYGSDVAVPAARLSRAVGRPVHVGWTRPQEFQHSYLRPPTRHWLRAELTTDGRIDTLAHWQVSGEVAATFVPGLLLAVTGDFGAWRGARIAYGILNRFTRTHALKLPVPTSWWRGLGLLANTFAVESFIDELAHAAGADPLDYRLRHLPVGEAGERFRNVLQAAAEKAGWGRPVSAGRALGLACCTDVGTICAQVAEVSAEAGALRVHKVTCAIDPGLIINPDGVIAQTEGAITMGLSSALLEEIRLENGRVQANNFDTYPIITMRDTPDIEVVLLESGPSPYGVGEPPIGPIAAAVANAAFTLTGLRLRSLPLKLA